MNLLLSNFYHTRMQLQQSESIQPHFYLKCGQRVAKAILKARKLKVKLFGQLSWK